MEKIKYELENEPEWIRPDMRKEKGELERVNKDFLKKDPSYKNLVQLSKIIESSPITELSDSDWESLENTDSFHNVHVGEIDEAKRITDKYNSELATHNRRDFDKLLEGFLNGNKMECPTILKNKEGKLHLVSGNTRLMIARALGIRPRVIITEIA